MTEVISNSTAQSAMIDDGISQLVLIAGENCRAHGFHEDWPKPLSTSPSVKEVAQFKREQRRTIAEKLALIHGEVSEALEEIRSGRDPLEVYYVDHEGVLGEKGREYEKQVYCPESEGTVPLLKPEGFLVELADVLIRTADSVYLVNGSREFCDALGVKHEYNLTRPYKHGREF